MKARAIQVAKGVARSDATQIASWCHEHPGYQLAASAIAAVNGWAGPTKGLCSEGRLVRGDASRAEQNKIYSASSDALGLARARISVPQN